MAKCITQLIVEDAFNSLVKFHNFHSEIIIVLFN